MNHWVQQLNAGPPLLVQAIARAQQVRVPRHAPTAVIAAQLWAALGPPAVVRARWAALAPALQAAVRDLAGRRGGADPALIITQYGAVRSWTALLADPRPQSTTEHLLLGGWLLPRPAAPRHPVRWLVPPELRRALPQVPVFAAHGVAPARLTPALLVLPALVSRLAHGPIPQTHRQTVPSRVRRRLARHAPDLPTPLGPLLRWLLPLLVAEGVVLATPTHWTLAPAASRWLSQSPAAQQAALIAAWLRHPAPDAWLRPVRAAATGLDAPAFRRRLLAWVDALPALQWLDPAPLYPILAAACGPLGDQHTHPWRWARPAPWHAPSAAQVWQAALRGPLHWLGAVTWTARGDQVSAQPAPAWPDQPPSYGATVGQLGCARGDTRLLAAFPTAQISAVTATHMTLQLPGHSPASAPPAAWDALAAAAGPLPAAWESWRATSTLSVIADGLILQGPPALLATVRQHRTVRRYLTALAPGLALIPAPLVPAATRALDQLQLPIALPAAEAVASAVTLTVAEQAAVVGALQLAAPQWPADAGLALPPDLAPRLAAMLSPALQAALAQAFPPRPLTQPAAPTVASSAPSAPPDLAVALQTLIAQRRPVTLHYTDAAGAVSARLVYPLAVDTVGAHQYLRAWCRQRRAERSFRLDRILALDPDPPPTAQ